MSGGHAAPNSLLGLNGCVHGFEDFSDEFLTWWCSGVPKAARPTGFDGARRGEASVPNLAAELKVSL